MTSNFIISVLLARWLSPQDYGAFSVAYAILWIFTNLHISTITEPLAVFGPGRYKDRLSEYLGILLYGHLGFSLIAAILLLLSSLALRFAGSDALASALLSLVVAGPLILYLRGLMRGACYVRLKPRLAALGGASYMALVLPGAYLLYERHWLSPSAGLLLMGFASLLPGLWLTAYLRVKPVRLRGSEIFRNVLNDHSVYGRWAVPSNGFGFVASQSYLLLLPIWGGLEASGAYRAMTNLATPIVHIASAFSLFLLPTLVQAREQGGFGRNIRIALALFIVGSGFYWVLLGFFHRPIVLWLYGDHYANYANLLWFLGLVPLLTGLVSLLGAALRALQRPDQIFRAQVLASAVALTVGVGLLIVWGVAGAAIGNILSQAVAVAALLWLLRKERNAAK